MRRSLYATALRLAMLLADLCSPSAARHNPPAVVIPLRSQNGREAPGDCTGISYRAAFVPESVLRVRIGGGGGPSRA
jgi:hypothetical protein